MTCLQPPGGVGGRKCGVGTATAPAAQPVALQSQLFLSPAGVPESGSRPHAPETLPAWPPSSSLLCPGPHTPVRIGGGGGFPSSVSGTDGETEAGRLPPRPEACKAPTAPPAGLSHRTSRQAHLLSLSLPSCGPSSRGPAQPAPSPHLCMAVPSPQHDLGLLWTDPNFILGRNLGRQPPRPLSVPQPWELRAWGGSGCGRRTWAPVAPTSHSVHGESQRDGSA